MSAVACSGCGSSLALSREAAGEDRGSDEPRRHRRLSRRVELFGAIFTLLLIFAALICVPRFSRSLKTKPESAEAAKSGAITWNGTPVFFARARPRDYTEETLAEALRQKLTPEEASQAVNPLSSTPGMETWAVELTDRATNDLQKAKLLCDALASHQYDKPFRFPGVGSAKEVFAAWNTPGACFRCQELAYLYVALARAVGLRAYFVSVEQQCNGGRDLHHCAAVFLAGQALLSDPAFWFGVPHRSFTLLDDVQAVATHLSALGDVKASQIAWKLAPDLSIVHLNRLHALAVEGRWEEAQEEVAPMMRLDPEGAMTYYARAVIAWRQQRPEQAIDLLHKAIELAPARDALHVLLANIYARQGKLIEARKSYENALRCPSSEERAQEVRQAIAHITNPDANYYLARGSERQAQGDWDGALTNYDKAVELGSGYAEAYLSRGGAKHGKGDPDGALADFSKAIQLNSKTAPAFWMLGHLHYDRHEFSEALGDLRKACELGSTGDYVHFRMWLARSRLGETGEATKELQEYLDSHRSVKPGDWPSTIGGFLVGQVSEPELFKFAESGDNWTNAAQHCEAYYYAGSKRLILGDKTTAATYFEKCIATNVKGFTEYLSAAMELRWLKGPGLLLRNGVTPADANEGVEGVKP